MSSNGLSHSPNILIYIEVAEKQIRLADVMNQSATLYESAEIEPNTAAALVFVIDGEEEREKIVLENGIKTGEQMITFSYAI